MSGSPDSYKESGYFHLSRTGWIRKDSNPPPPDRQETWRYELERPSHDTKDEVTLTRIWMSKGMTDAQSIALHSLHGEAVEPTIKRNVTLDCHV